MAAPLPSGLRSLKLDASGEGCTGMFWRGSPVMTATVSRSDWPRNGTMLVGTWETHGGLAWARFERTAAAVPAALFAASAEGCHHPL